MTNTPTRSTSLQVLVSLFIAISLLLCAKADLQLLQTPILTALQLLEKNSVATSVDEIPSPLIVNSSNSQKILTVVNNNSNHESYYLLASGKDIFHFANDYYYSSLISFSSLTTYSFSTTLLIPSRAPPAIA